MNIRNYLDRKKPKVLHFKVYVKYVVFSLSSCE